MGLISNSIKKIKNFFNNIKNQYTYDFLTEAEKAFPNQPNKESEALKWFKKVRQDKKYQYRASYPKGGRLYWFTYHDPLTKDKLEYWDVEPLVIMSSTFTTEKGERRVLGLNLHLLPPHVRTLVFAEIFAQHRKRFLEGLNNKSKQPSFNFSLKAIMKNVEKYGADFAIRMYAPSQMKSVIEFPTEDWSKAVYIPSRRYQGTNLAKLEKEWSRHIRSRKARSGL